MKVNRRKPLGGGKRFRGERKSSSRLEKDLWIEADVTRKDTLSKPGLVLVLFYGEMCFTMSTKSFVKIVKEFYNVSQWFSRSLR